METAVGNIQKFRGGTEHQLKMAIFTALKNHKYNYPIATINYIQKIFDVLKEYKRTDGDDELLDTKALYGVIGGCRSKDDYFRHH